MFRNHLFVMIIIYLSLLATARAVQFHDMSYDEINSALTDLHGPSAIMSSVEKLWGPRMVYLRCKHVPFWVIMTVEKQFVRGIDIKNNRWPQL